MSTTYADMDYFENVKEIDVEYKCPRVLNCNIYQLVSYNVHICRRPNELEMNEFSLLFSLQPSSFFYNPCERSPLPWHSDHLQVYLEFKPSKLDSWNFKFQVLLFSNTWHESLLYISIMVLEILGLIQDFVKLWDFLFIFFKFSTSTSFSLCFLEFSASTNYPARRAQV